MTAERLLESLRARQQILRDLSGLPHALPQQAPVKVSLLPAPASSSEKFQSTVAVLKAVSEEYKKTDPKNYAEIQRIINIRIEPPVAPEEVEAFSQMRCLAEAYQTGFRLFPCQAQAIMAWESGRGVFGPIGVGWGKTLITLMIAESAYRMGLMRILLLVPTQVYGQLVQRDIAWARRRVPLTVPFVFLGGLAAEERSYRSSTGRKGCYILPYSVLSTKTAETLLRNIWPDVVIADEVHQVKNASAARTKRIQRLLHDRKPYFCAFSGTITSKALKDYQHLIVAALHDGAPVPLSVVMAGEWGAVIDAEAGGGNTGPIEPLLEWAKENFPQNDYPIGVTGFRRAFRVRLNTAPGVVNTGEEEIGTSLVIQPRPVLEAPRGFIQHAALAGFDVPGAAELSAHIRRIEDEYQTPTGDEIEFGIHTFKWLYELSAGFYNSLIWPSVEDLAKKRMISEQQAFEILESAKRHHAAGQEYTRNLRSWLDQFSRQGLDTPLLVASNMAHYGPRDVGNDLFEKWREWKALDFDGRPERISVPVRVCPFKIDAAVEWAKTVPSGAGALIWYYHIEFGEWLKEALTKAGLPAILCAAGEQHNRAILNPENENRIIVASMGAHGTGKNLQAFQYTYLSQFPRQATMLEQVLGRNHRNGQTADVLEVVTNATLEFDYLVVSAALNDALYIQQTTGSRQKAIYAGYDPIPQIFPYEVLRERGLDPKKLDASTEKEFFERFGKAGAQ